MRRFFLLFTALILAGCTTLFKTAPLEGLTAIYTWTAKGQMVFQCAMDDEGLYWQFLFPQGKLYNDQGRFEGELLPDFGVKARDGSAASARIVEQKEANSPRDLKPALFEATGSLRGTMKNLRYIERRYAKGGMPQTKCSPSQRGKRLYVPFTARYIFYR